MSRPTLTLRVLEATETGQLVELLYDDGANDEVLLCAAHGGAVEPGTAEQALELAVRLPGATCWACLGYDSAAEEFEQWHPPSSAIAPEDYPLLADIADRGFETVISFHGLADDAVFVGGGIDSEVKERVREGLAPEVTPPVETVSEGPYAGTSPNNFVNWLAAEGGGLQLEQSRSVRDEEAEAVLAVLEALVAEDVL